MPRYLSAALAAVLILAAAGSLSAQPMPAHDPGAAANVRESKEYSALLRSNPSFRKKREAIECGPITDAQLRANCVASFESSASPGGH
jgi:hypothetical protein